MKKITLSFIVAIFVVSFIGCSSKQITPPQQSKTSNVNEVKSTDAGVGGGQNGIAVGNPPAK
jgi:hypothetical protein